MSDLEKKGFKEILPIVESKNGFVRFKFKDNQNITQEFLAGVEKLQFMVGGFNKDGSHHVFIVSVPGEIEQKRNSTEAGKEYGASWIGQADVVSRIVLGFDGRIQNLQMIQSWAKSNGPQSVQQQLSGLEYNIQWGTMTLQDGVDFSVLAIQTTAAMQRFSDGIRIDSGDMPGVGGPIDVAIITPDSGFRWIAKKDIKVDGKGINL